MHELQAYLYTIRIKLGATLVLPFKLFNPRYLGVPQLRRLTLIIYSYGQMKRQ